MSDRLTVVNWCPGDACDPCNCTWQGQVRGTYRGITGFDWSAYPTSYKCAHPFGLGVDAGGFALLKISGEYCDSLSVPSHPFVIRYGSTAAWTLAGGSLDITSTFMANLPGLGDKYSFTGVLKVGPFADAAAVENPVIYAGAETFAKAVPFAGELTVNELLEVDRVIGVNVSPYSYTFETFNESGFVFSATIEAPPVLFFGVQSGGGVGG